MLDRSRVLQLLLADHAEWLIVAGLGNAANDLAALTDEGANVFALDGAMGAATSVGLGLALARPDRRVLVVTGDGELLMNVGSLATVAVQSPGNLSILCLDNGEYGLTGGQQTHTAFGTDLEVMARGAGLKATITMLSEEEASAARAVLDEAADASIVVAKVAPGPGAAYSIDRNGPRIRSRFRSANRPPVSSQ